MFKSKVHKSECLPDMAKNRVALKVIEAKKEAASLDEPMPKIYKKHFDPLLDEGINLVTNVSSFENMKCALYSERKKQLKLKKLVYKTLHEVEIPANFKSFLVADYTCIGGDARIIVFASERTEQLLPITDDFFFDATFKSTPKPFYQLMVIHGDTGSTTDKTKISPLFFALMSDKKENSYFALFDIIKTRFPEWNPIKIHADFEIAPTNALDVIFSECPTVIIKRCYAHFVRSLYKKAKTLGLKAKIYKRIVGLYSALPLLPQEFIQEGLEYIKTECMNMEKMNVFMAYFDKYYVKSEKFVREWCVSSERHRTNNVCESWNSKLNKSINKNYVTVLKLLHTLKEDFTAKNTFEKKRDRLQLLKDDLIIQSQMQLINQEITVGYFLEKLR